MRLPVTLIVAVLLAAAPATARQLTAQNLERAAIFAQRMQSAYDEGMALSFKLDSAEDYIDRFYAGEIERPEFTANLEPFLANIRAAIDQYRSRYRHAPSPPSIGSEKHERNLAAFAGIVVETGGMLERQLEVVYALRDAAIAGDQNAYDLATADSLALASEMILDENAALTAALVAIEPGHPQQGLTKAIIGGNEAMAVALKVMEAVFRGEEFDTSNYSLDVEAGLLRADRGIAEGERSAARMLRDLEGKFAKTDADRYSARFIGDLVEAYERAFAIEREILEVERGLLDYLRAVNSGEEGAGSALATVGELQAGLAEWTARRVEEQNIRLEMSAEFARKMQSMHN